MNHKWQPTYSLALKQLVDAEPIHANCPLIPDVFGRYFLGNQWCAFHFALEFKLTQQLGSFNLQYHLKPQDVIRTCVVY